MDAIQLIIAKLKDGIARIKELYTFIFQNFLPGIGDDTSTYGFEFF